MDRGQQQQPERTISKQVLEENSAKEDGKRKGEPEKYRKESRCIRLYNMNPLPAKSTQTPSPILQERTAEPFNNALAHPQIHTLN